ncbi:hypothetical protein ABTN20_19860, partial [Acinetobacter baumannii]
FPQAVYYFAKRKATLTEKFYPRLTSPLIPPYDEKFIPRHIMQALILVLNCGSSSIKFSLRAPHNNQDYCKGVIEKIGTSEAILTFSVNG